MVPEWLLYLLSVVISIALGSAVWHFWSHGQRHTSLWIGIIGVELMVLVVGLRFRNELVKQEIKARTPIYFGELTPGDDPTPPLPANTPADTISLPLGDDLRVLSTSSSQYVFRRGDKRLLSIGLRGGKMWISAVITDSSSRNVVRIIENEFQAFPETAFNPRQPDEHSLVVRDSEGQEVLNLRFLNPRAIRITGRFFVQGFGVVAIDPQEGIRFPGGGGIGHLTLDMTLAPEAGVIQFK